jgi:ribosomal protein L14E/L6E/L27E
MGMSCEDDGLFPLGALVTIKRGKHRGSVCVVVGIDAKDGKILIANGIDISARRPKRKNPRHVEPANEISAEVAKRLAREKNIDDGWLNSVLSRREDKEFTTCS